MLIIEDEPEAEQTLCAHLERFAEEHHERFQISWLKTAFEFVQSKQKADIIFMDIQLPGINGVEAAEYLRSYDSRTVPIFVTNLAKYAVRGYTVDALDFIVKPVEYYDFSLRMAKALRVVDRNRSRSIYVGTKDGLAVMPASQVTAIEVARHNLSYHLVGEEEPVRYRGSLGKVEAELEGAPFVRISNNCLINIDHVRKINGPEVHLSTGEVFYISRARRKEALAAIANYYGGNS